MSEKVSNLDRAVESCLLKKLAANYDECTRHSEYVTRGETLKLNFQSLRQLLEQYDVRKNKSVSSDIVSSLLLLYLELKSHGEWNCEDAKDFADILDGDFERLYETKLSHVLYEETVFNSQDVYGNFLQKVHNKLSVTEYKKYPSLIEVYCEFIKDIKSYPVEVEPLKALPVSLLLMSDYIADNKLKGLNSCKSILECISVEDFSKGNYFQVVYQSLCRLLSDKELQITCLVSDCMLELIRVINLANKERISSEIFSKTLDEMNIESNINRKCLLLKLLENIVSTHKINCAEKKKKVHTIVFDNLNDCTNVDVREVMLPSLLNFFAEWIKHCWCIWKFELDHKLLSRFIKVLYALNDNDTENVKKVQNIIIILISLCDKDQQTIILKQLSCDVSKNEDINKRKEIILQHFTIKI